MTGAGVQALLDSAKKIGDGVWYFFHEYKDYKPKFTDKEGKILSREEVLEKYPKLIEKYDEIKEAMDWLDISDMFTSSQAQYNIRRFDFTHSKVEGDNYVILDKDNGDLHYVATDQINLFVRYDKDQLGYELNKKTGEVEEKKVNENKIRINHMYKG